MSKQFLLPDLGEGLPDATIVEWYVKVGDTIRLDDNLVSMETAKAVVDVPSPVSGKILKLAGAAGDIIVTVGGTTGTGTLLDTDPTPSVTVASVVSATEGGELVFGISLSNASATARSRTCATWWWWTRSASTARTAPGRRRRSRS